MKMLTRNILMASVLIIPYAMIMYFLVMTIMYMPLQDKESKNIVEYKEGKIYKKDFFEENKLYVNGIRVGLEKGQFKNENFELVERELSEEMFYYYLEWTIEAINEMHEEFNFKKENWHDLEVVICECEIKEENGNVLGYILPYKNKIYISSNIEHSTRVKYKDIVFHEIGHFIYENKLSYKFKMSYYKEYIENKDFTLSEKLEFTSFYRQDKYTKETESKKWSEMIEERIVEDIKTVLSKNKMNKATKKETTEEAREKMKKEIRKEKERNITNRKILELTE